MKGNKSSREEDDFMCTSFLSKHGKGKKGELEGTVYYEELLSPLLSP